MYHYDYPELLKVPTIDNWGWKVDTQWRTSFTGTVRRYAKKQYDRVRVEHQTLQYYTNDVPTIEKLVKYVNRLNSAAESPLDIMLDIKHISYFPGTLTDRNIRYRKKRLPYGKYRFEILGQRLTPEAYNDWTTWVDNYPDSIRINHNIYRKWGTWCGESIGYVVDEKMLQLVQFKLGSNINTIVEYQIRETK